MMKIFDNIICREERIEEILDKSVSGEKHLITYFNKHCFNVYQDNPYYRKCLENFKVYTDGIGIYFALKILGRNPGKHNATDMNYNFFAKFIQKKTSLFFVGGSFNEEEIFRLSEARGINFAGYKNGFFRNDLANVIEKIISVNPDMVIVGMGVPQQEIFAEKLSEKFSGSVLCVGNFLEFYFGTAKRAPSFLRRIGFEWLFRLITEPKRLFKRYVFGIPLFVYRILKIKAGYNP